MQEMIYTGIERFLDRVDFKDKQELLKSIDNQLNIYLGSLTMKCVDNIRWCDCNEQDLIMYLIYLLHNQYKKEEEIFADLLYKYNFYKNNDITFTSNDLNNLVESYKNKLRKEN